MGVDVFLLFFFIVNRLVLYYCKVVILFYKESVIQCRLVLMQMF